ncbi:hypothetical protein AKO1_008734 [Acrasis kona]|uniref:Uncharacterized protein n=1 Tax=Acrasis kona TaxID=1008807 RepID=A0AAW2ZE72_9EUKA
MAVISKLAPRVARPLTVSNIMGKNVPNMIVVAIPQQRFRQIRQVPGLPFHQGWFDSFSNVYQDTRYTLDLKPLEYRGGNLNFVFEYLGLWMLFLPIAGVVCLAAFCLSWYTLVDPQTTVRRQDNPHPFLNIRNGTDYENTRLPVFKKVVIFGPSLQDYRIQYYHEIEHAIAAKKKYVDYLRDKREYEKEMALRVLKDRVERFVANKSQEESK